MPFRAGSNGSIRAVHGTSTQITLLTEHKEGFPTAVYRVSLDRLELSSIALPCGATHLLELGGSLYLAGTDGILRKLSEKSADPLGEFGEIRGITQIGESVGVLTADALHILDGQTIALPEPATAVAANSSASWIAIGTESGRLLSYTCEESDTYEPGESAQVHQAAITHLLFDPEELMVLSSALDKKLMMTHLRGELETAERSKKVHDEPISALIPGPAGNFYSASADGTIKTWATGFNRRAASTAKVSGQPQALAWWPDDRGCCMVVGKADKIRVIRMNAKSHKPDPSAVRITVHGIEQWAERDLSARDVRVREACMRALADSADALSVARLAESAATDSESNLRQLATDLLLRTSHATVDKALLKLLKAQDTSVSLKALDGLTSRGGTAIVSTCLALCKQVWAPSFPFLLDSVRGLAIVCP